MAVDVGKAFGVVPLFDPAAGMLVRSPLGTGVGWWAGAPSACFDSVSNLFYLVYRLRQPRDKGRGVECRIAASDNGISFNDIWALPKSSVDALSLERASLLRGLDGRWRLYLSYVNPDDGKWRIGALEGTEPDGFDVSRIEPLFSAESVSAEGVKDPNVFLIGRMYYMLVSYAEAQPKLSAEEYERMHAGGDIFNTGLTRSRTGAAISGDGRTFTWLGDVSPAHSAAHGKPAWDAYCARVTGLLPFEGGGFLAFYDGSASVEENYEEKTGLATTFDLKTFHSLSATGPSLVSPFGSGSLRYLDVLPVGHELFYYYEMARADGGHELRVGVVERA